MSHPITVRELIEKLQELPPDAYVLTEGCDCEGPCSGVRVQNSYKGAECVLLVRDDTLEHP